MHRPSTPAGLTLPLPDDGAPLLAGLDTPPPASMNFAALLAEGIGYAQAMSSDQWTDYNEHDPGLTILEQLCYALTDLGMRGQYRVEDLLADENGQVGRQSLFSGDRVLSGAPLNQDDYRRLLYDHVEGLKNFWLLPVEPGLPGLYRGVIEQFDGFGGAAILADVDRLLRRHRNLGEDLVELLLLTRHEVALAGTVVLAAGGDVDEVMAAILFDLNLHLVPGPALTPRDTRLAAGVPWDAIYEGPLLYDGVIDQLGQAALPQSIELHQVARIVQRSVGVGGLAELRFRGVAGPTLTLDPNALPFFDVPAAHAPWPLAMRDAGGAALTPNRERVARFMLRLRSALHEAETAGQHSVATLGYRRKMHGRQLDVGNYYSIQHQFPVTYGLSRYGVPANLYWQAGAARGGDLGPAPDGPWDGRPVAHQRVAQARQLCAYLLLFEQMLANGFSQLAAARQLFAVRTAPRRSYFCQALVGATARDRDAPQAPYVLAAGTAPAPAPPPQPQPQRSGGHRYQVRVYAHRRGDPVWAHQPVGGWEPALYSARLADRATAHRLLELIRERGMAAQHYATAYGGDGGFTLELLGADGATLAHGRHRYAAWEQASAAAVALAARLRHAHQHAMSGRYVRLRRQPAAGIQVFLHGQVVLSAFWDAPLSERDRLAERVLRLGADPGNYRPRRRGHGWRYDLYEGGRPVARGHLYDADREAARRQSLGVAALLRQIGGDPDAYLRHVELLPDDGPAPAAGPDVGPDVAAPDNAQGRYVRRLEKIVASFDDFATRRNTFLDHLLARFDEGFEDARLQDLDPRPANGEAFLHELASWKSSFLAAYPGAGARRGCGADYGRRLVHEMPFGAGLEHRLHSLLGIGGVHDFARYPSSRPRLARRRPALHEDANGDADEPALEFRYRRPDLLPMLLKYGTDPARYDILRRRSDPRWRLYFVRPDGRRLRLMTDPRREDLAHARDRLIAWLARGGPAWRQMYEDEGLYVIEHILLRPLKPELDAQDAHANFHGQRISVLFPAWPVRFRNPLFRQLARSLLAQHGPAHLGCDCYWLEYGCMGEFETLYAGWSKAKREATRRGRHDAGELHRHARALRQFLLRLAGQEAP